MGWLRGADFRVLLQGTGFATIFVACERIGLQLTSPALPVSNTEGVRGNSFAQPARGTQANIGDIIDVRITLVQPSVDPSVNIWQILRLAPNDYCNIQIMGIHSRDGRVLATSLMNCLYTQMNAEATIPGKCPPTMVFVGDGVTASEASLLIR